MKMLQSWGSGERVLRQAMAEAAIDIPDEDERARLLTEAREAARTTPFRFSDCIKAGLRVRGTGISIKALAHSIMAFGGSLAWTDLDPEVDEK